MKVKVVALPVETWAVILDVLGSATDCGPRDEGWKSPELSEAHTALDFALGKTEEIESPKFEKFARLAPGEYRYIPVSEILLGEQPSNEPPSIGIPAKWKDEQAVKVEDSSNLNSAMTPVITPEGFDEAAKELVETLESPVEWTQVESSNLSAVAYQEDLQLLLVEFKGGKVYKYAGVPKGVSESLMSADSKGRFFAANIKDHFPAERLEVKREQD